MKRIAACLSIAIYALSPGAHASCVLLTPELRAEVFVLGCEAKTYYATAADLEYYRRTRQEPDPSALRVSGTLLTIEVLSREPAYAWASIGAKTWPKCEHKALFVAKPPIDVCPASATMTVITNTPCCDMGRIDVCLVPRDVTVVAVATML